MTSIQLTPDERVRAVQRFGYTQREAEFMSVAALSGGYFLRRQYERFLNQQDGGGATRLTERALALNHIQVLTYQHKIHIHHVCARPFYEALGQGDNRNRRQRQPLTIKNKLMGLDFVLEHPARYLATEHEKLDFFARTLQLPASALPSKLYRAADGASTTARYFVEKYPIFLPGTTPSGGPPVVSFCYVDEGTTTLSRFETYLAQYSALFAALRQFGLIYVAATPARFSGAQAAFEAFVRKHFERTHATVVDPEIRRMLEHFAARRLYETKQLDGFDRSKLIRYRNEREEFSGIEMESLYHRWTIGGDSALLNILAPNAPPPARCNATFSTCLLEHRYDLFGTLTAY